MKRHLNLFPWKLRWEMLLRRRLWQWCAGWAILAVGLVTFLGWRWHGLTRAQDELSVWQRRASTVQGIDAQNAQLRQQIAGLTARLKKYGHLESEQIGFQLLATISQSSSFCAGNIQVRKLTFQHLRVPDTTVAKEAKADAKAPPMRDVRKLLLNGVAKDKLDVARFVSSLRDSGAFQTVDLKSTLNSVVADAGSHTYHVECSF